MVAMNVITFVNREGTAVPVTAHGVAAAPRPLCKSMLCHPKITHEGKSTVFSLW